MTEATAYLNSVRVEWSSAWDNPVLREIRCHDLYVAEKRLRRAEEVDLWEKRNPNKFRPFPDSV